MFSSLLYGNYCFFVRLLQFTGDKNILVTSIGEIIELTEMLNNKILIIQNKENNFTIMYFSLSGGIIMMTGISLAGFRRYLDSLPEENSKRKHFWFVLK